MSECLDYGACIGHEKRIVNTVVIRTIKSSAMVELSFILRSFSAIRGVSERDTFDVPICIAFEAVVEN